MVYLLIIMGTRELVVPRQNDVWFYGYIIYNIILDSSCHKLGNEGKQNNSMTAKKEMIWEQNILFVKS